MPIYNKLVRDFIPDVIKADGIPKYKIKTRILRAKEYRCELLKKLVEESKEALEAKDNEADLIKELGDVKEVLEAVEKSYSLDSADILGLKEKRRNSRGGFEKKIFLISVDE